VLVELIRLFYTGDINEAQHLVDNLIQIQVPEIQDFDGFLKILDPKLELKNKILLFSLHRKEEGITAEDIMTWTKERYQRGYVSTVLSQLENDQCYLHSTEGRYYITLTGILEISKRHATL
jgi:hypothetical protein